MRTAFRVLLVALSVCVLLASATVPALAVTTATFGSSVAVGTYSYGLLGAAPIVTVVDTDTTATMTVSIITAATANAQVSLNGVVGLPDGITLTTDTFLGTSAAVGFEVAVSNSASTVQTVQIVFPALTVAQNNSFNAGLLGVLYFDATSQAYVQVPASDVNVNSASMLTVTYNMPGYFYIVNFNTNPVEKSIASGVATFLVAKNAVQSFAVNVAATGSQKAIQLANFTANAAGTITVSVSAQATTEGSASYTAGRIVLSNIYNITYNSAATAQSGVLTFYGATSTVASNTYNDGTAAWYRLQHGATTWVQQASTVNADASVSAQVSGFSDWSVQASAAGSSSTGSQGGSAATFAPAALLVAALAAMLMA